jgi:hypothetical protein
MIRSKVRWGFAASLFVLSAAVVQPAEAQLSELRWRIHGGIVQPIGGTSDYFAFGPSVGVDAGLPLNDRAAVHLEFDWNYLNTTDYYPTPVTNLWGYRATVEAALLGSEGSGPRINVFGGAGGTTVHSHRLYRQQNPDAWDFEGERFSQTGLTATGGVRVGVVTPDGNPWWLSLKLLWMPVSDVNQEILQDLSVNQANPNGLSPLGSAMNASITIGIGL